MIRVFSHYVLEEQVLLVAGSAIVVSGSLHLGPVLPALSGGLAPTVPLPSMLPTLVLTALVVVTLHVAGVYDLREAYTHSELILRVALAFMPAYALVGALGFLFPAGGLGRWVYVSSLMLGVVWIVALRLAFDRIEADPRRQRQVLLVGTGPAARVVAEIIHALPRRYRLLGCVEPPGEEGARGSHSFPIAGRVSELEWILKVEKPDVIVVASEDRNSPLPSALPMDTILAYKIQGTEVEDWATFYEKVMGKIHIANLQPRWLVFSDGFRAFGIAKALKRVIDVAVALPGSILTALLTPLLALIIKLDSRGPVFYRQERVGEHGRVFSLVKFRTMRLDAELATGPVWASTDDPRVTRVGRVLRRSRLDELPQFFNVLRGEMSLVGPRPERPAFVAQLQERVPFYGYRHAVKPGITGWAQVRYPYGASLEDGWEKLQYDLYYIKNMSIFLDLIILMQTINVMLFRRGAR
jgi:sugar transferase (PEP-CTERM system associated)